MLAKKRFNAEKNAVDINSLTIVMRTLKQELAALKSLPEQMANNRAEDY